ncbi:hypothetical protein UK23_42925 [Lentzea aerocolonigenes]|uniref:CheR-type methyltransferase domain-containing protein n=1 Tax=Lentzea aerocolonigenes TaxID=68170 RepID=A0A0F0GHB5_LENAE|nr:hypothetical protein UK23_42925 [Lentzea aerocolonigenes]
MRRVRHRMSQIGIEDYGDYIDHLQVNAEEFNILFNTILINVTAFFRAPEAWAYLREEVIPTILAERGPDDPIRVWSAGCASGEEAYSLAIALAEAVGPERFRQQVKIYATDVDDEALTHARHASYAEQDVQSLPPELTAKYFEHQNGRYSFRKDLRRSVIFGRNDLVQDAPISRIDLLVCRNALMYFNQETQAKILGRFHFALVPKGVLFLGKAEMLLSHSRIFDPIDLKRRIFRKAAGITGHQPTSSPTRWCTIAGWTSMASTSCGNTLSRRARSPRSSSPRTTSWRSSTSRRRPRSACRRRTSAGRCATSTSPTGRWSCADMSSRRGSSASRCASRTSSGRAGRASRSGSRST